MDDDNVGDETSDDVAEANNEKGASDYYDYYYEYYTDEDIRLEAEWFARRCRILFNRGKIWKLAKKYTKDTTVMPTGEDTIYGRAGVRKMFKEMYKNGYIMKDNEIIATGGTYKQWWSIVVTTWKQPDGTIIKNRSACILRRGSNGKSRIVYQAVNDQP